jgi:hypothetical protein
MNATSGGNVDNMQQELLLVGTLLLPPEVAVLTRANATSVRLSNAVRLLV